MSTPTEVPQTGDARRDAAIAALALLSQVDDAQVAGVLAVVQATGKPAESSQLRATGDAASALHGVAQATAAKFRDSELIDYGPGALATDEQVMWLDIANVPLLKNIDEESESLADLPLFQASKSDVTN